MKLYRIPAERMPELQRAIHELATEHFMKTGEMFTLQSIKFPDDNSFLNVRIIGCESAAGGECCQLLESGLDLPVRKLSVTECEKPESNWVGVIGELFTAHADVYYVLPLESEYGTKYLHKMRSSSNGSDELVWFSSRRRYDEGHYHLRGRVKEHSTYEGTKQTVLTHCKLERAIDETKFTATVTTATATATADEQADAIFGKL